ncbi:MFS transporter [Emcibacter sp.]|uniref:MFS transporter n=1 Tax=Emcibacter sp. TaxID=1979954 RepID=UPI002AA95590|nr:MFS transporter [Emcibacter sp.]
MKYETKMATILSITFGIAFFDRNAVNFLVPFIAPDLGLTNTQIGLLSSALSLTWAISGYALGALSDATGRRKIFLLISIFVFSCCSFLSGLATSFMMLLAARLLMGLSEGPMMPVSHAMVVKEVSPERRGLYMGFVQNFGSNLLGSFAAPVVLVALAEMFNWRVAFFISGVPGLVAAFFIWKYIREPAAQKKLFPKKSETEGGAPAQKKMNTFQLFRYRNIVLCGLISILSVSYLVIAWAFMPIFFVQSRGFEPSTMSWLMGTLGISATVCAFLVPGLSDRFGRKPILVLFSFIGVICPLSALYFDGPVVMLAALIFIGWALNGTFPVFMATVPAETVPAGYVATVMGLIMAIGEIIGGFSAPAIAGWAADQYSLQAPLFIQTGCAIASGLLALGLKETAPAKVGNPAPSPA